MGWYWCADEGGECIGSGGVRFGTEGKHFKYKAFNGSIKCDADTVGGDPRKGHRKHCDVYYDSDAAHANTVKAAQALLKKQKAETVKANAAAQTELAKAIADKRKSDAEAAALVSGAALYRDCSADIRRGHFDPKCTEWCSTLANLKDTTDPKRVYCDKPAFEFCQRHPNYAPCFCLTQHPTDAEKALSNALPKQCFWQPHCTQPTARFRAEPGVNTCKPHAALNSRTYPLADKSHGAALSEIAGICASELGCGGFQYQVPMTAPPSNKQLGKTKNCPPKGCIDGNRPYTKLDAAWNACAVTPECDFVMQSRERFYLRRDDDPDGSASDGLSGLYAFEGTHYLLDHEPGGMKCNPHAEGSCIDGPKHRTMGDALAWCNQTPACQYIVKDAKGLYSAFRATDIEQPRQGHTRFTAFPGEKTLRFCEFDTFEASVDEDDVTIDGLNFVQLLPNDPDYDEEREGGVSDRAGEGEEPEANDALRGGVGSVVSFLEKVRSKVTGVADEEKEVEVAEIAAPPDPYASVPRVVDAQLSEATIFTSHISKSNCPDSLTVCSISDITINNKECNTESCASIHQSCGGGGQEPANYLSGTGKLGNVLGVQCSADFGSSTPCCGQTLKREIGEEEACPAEKPLCMGFVKGKSWGICTGTQNLLAPYPKEDAGRLCKKGECLDDTGYRPQEAILKCQQNAKCTHVMQQNNLFYLRRSSDAVCITDNTPEPESCTTSEFSKVKWCSDVGSFDDASWGCCIKKDRSSCPRNRGAGNLQGYPRCRGGERCPDKDATLYELKPTQPPQRASVLTSFLRKRLQQKPVADSDGAAVITCKATADNSIKSVTYDGAEVSVTGDKDSWMSVKTFSFTDAGPSASLVVTAQDADAGNTGHCDTGGFSMTCTSDSSGSPWHKLTAADAVTVAGSNQEGGNGKEPEGGWTGDVEKGACDSRSGYRFGADKKSPKKWAGGGQRWAKFVFNPHS